jgi:hypothetical protein
MGVQHLGEIKMRSICMWLGILIMIGSYGASQEIPVKSFSACFIVDASGNVKIYAIYASYDYLSKSDENPNYLVALMDTHGKIQYELGIRLVYIERTIMDTITAYDDTNIDFNTVKIYMPTIDKKECTKVVSLPLLKDAPYIALYDANFKLIKKVRWDKMLCNENNICEKNENALACSDCSAEHDNYCNPAYDGVCDRDCSLEMDADCVAPKQVRERTEEKTPYSSSESTTKEEAKSDILPYVIAALVLLAFVIAAIKRRK